jgi:hypothetical protein
MECCICGREIPPGEPFLSIDYHIERTEEALFITVERAESLLTACIDCAPSRGSIAKTVRATVTPFPHQRTS